MEKREIKKILKAELGEFGFKYVKKGYYYIEDDLIIVVELQYSNYDDTFFINYGFSIKALHPELEYPKENMCDIRGRFILRDESNKIIDFHLNDCSSEEFSATITAESKRIFLPVIEGGINRYFELEPSAIARTTKKARDYLGIEI